MVNMKELSKAEKDKAIAEILDKGLTSPIYRLKKIWKFFSFCNPKWIFFDMGDCIFLGLLIAFTGWIILLQADEKFICCVLFGISPFVYIASYLLVSWKEYRQQMYEMKMACLYSLYQVTALRMLYFSILNLTLNSAVLVMIREFHIVKMDFWRMLGISFSSIFIYGILILIFKFKGKRLLSYVTPPFFWIALNAVIYALWNRYMEKVIMNMSVWIVYAITAILLLVYIVSLYIYTIRNRAGTVRAGQ